MSYILNSSKTHQGILGVLEEYKNDWMNIQPFVETKNRLDDLIKKSDELRAVIGVKSNSVTMSKNNTRSEMRKDIVLILDALTAYAEINNDNTLKNETAVQSKRFSKSRKDIDVYDICTCIYTMADPYKTQLLDYNISQLLLDRVKNSIVTFKKNVSLPNTIIKSNKVSKQKLRSVIREINYLLKNQSDRLINLIAADSPELAEKYFAIRPQIKTRGKKKKPVATIVKAAS